MLTNQTQLLRSHETKQKGKSFKEKKKMLPLSALKYFNCPTTPSILSVHIKPPYGTVAALLVEAVDQGTRHQGKQRGIQLRWKEHQGSVTRRSLKKNSLHKNVQKIN